MATLLMVESTAGAAGLVLPGRIVDRGHRYVLVTRDPAVYGPAPIGTPHPVVRDADEVVVADTGDDAALRVAVEAVAGRRRVDGVLTTCDHSLRAAAVAAAHLGLPGPSPDAMRIATRKDLVREALSAAGLPNPRFAVAAGAEDAASAAARVGYPLVAGPVDLGAGVGVRLVADEAGLREAVAAIRGAPADPRGQGLQRSVLLEEVLTGTEVSVEAVSHGGRTTVMAVTDKSVAGGPAFVASGHMVPAPLDPPDAAAAGELAAAALDAVGVTLGLGHVEVMLTGAGPRVVELNPHQGGGWIFELVELVTGTHPLDVLVDLALGRAPLIGAATPRPARVPTVPSAAIVHVLAPRPGVVVAAEGTARLDADPGVVRWELPTPARARPPVDNDADLGHLVAVGDSHRDARQRAEAALAGVRLVMADGERVRPCGFARHGT